MSQKIATEKLRTNVAEYLLYMWQIEDIVRSFAFDLDAIEFQMIRPVVTNEEEVKSELLWYKEVVRSMKEEGLEKKGHMSKLRDLVAELNFIHQSWLSMSYDESYKDLVEDSKTYLDDFRILSQAGQMNDVELCLNGLYAKLLLRLKKQTISPETEKAFDAFRKIISRVSSQYHKSKQNERDFHFQMN
jgi:hypothetical protein